MTTDTRKQTLIAMLHKFIRQRPGLEFGNYCSDWRDTAGRAAYRAEVSSIGKDLREAGTLLRAVELRDSITADAILEAARSAFSGRLSITEPTPGRFVLDYCVGQYWPTEYRRAVCAVLSSALRAYWRDQCMPEPIGTTKKTYGAGDTAVSFDQEIYRGGLTAGAFLRKTARDEFGRGIASRWFN